MHRRTQLQILLENRLVSPAILQGLKLRQAQEQIDIEEYLLQAGVAEDAVIKARQESMAARSADTLTAEVWNTIRISDALIKVVPAWVSSWLSKSFDDISINLNSHDDPWSDTIFAEKETISAGDVIFLDDLITQIYRCGLQYNSAFTQSWVALKSNFSLHNQEDTCLLHLLFKQGLGGLGNSGSCCYIQISLPDGHIQYCESQSYL